MPLCEVEYDHSSLWHEEMLACQATSMQQLDCHNDLLRVMVLHRSIWIKTMSKVKQNNKITKAHTFL